MLKDEDGLDGLLEDEDDGLLEDKPTLEENELLILEGLDELLFETLEDREEDKLLTELFIEDETDILILLELLLAGLEGLDVEDRILLVEPMFETETAGLVEIISILAVLNTGIEDVFIVDSGVCFE